MYFDLYDDYTEGARPDRLAGVRPQGRVQRRTVEQICDYTLIVPSLDVPVPQMANQLLEVCRQIDAPIPEQVIDVPKISFSRESRSRCVRFAEQTVEQLVEVPTIVSYSSLHGLVEQNVDIPVPLGRGRGRGGLGLHPGQSSTAFRGAVHRSVTVEQIVDIPAPRGGRDLPSATSSSGLPDTANQGVFSTFLPRKKRRRWARTRVRGCPPVSAHPHRRLSWRVSSLLRTAMCGCGFLLDNGCCLARTRMSSAMSPVRACPGCSGWSRLCGHAATYSSSLRRTVDGALQFFDRVVDIAVMLQRQVRTVSNCTLSSTPLSS